MADTTHEVGVEFVGKGNAAAFVDKLRSSSGKLLHKVGAVNNSLMRMSGILGAITGAVGLGKAVSGARSYLRTIEELSTITGEAANKTAGINHAMEQSGLRGEEMRAIMISISRKQAEIAGGSKEMAKMAKRYGVNLKKGPEEALVSMAKQVEKGKIGTGEIVKLLEESGAKAMDLLRKGGPEVQRLILEGGKKMSHINDKTIAQYKRAEIAVARTKQSWTRISTIVGVKLAPVIERLAIGVEKRIDSWAAGAQRFGDFMVKHMDTIIAMAKTYGKIMLANYTLMKLTGEGLAGNAGKIGGFLKGGFMKSKAARAKKAATAARLAKQTGFGAINLDKVLGARGFMGKLVKAFALLKAPAIIVAAKFIIIATVIGGVVSAISQVVKGSSEAGVKMRKLLGEIVKTAKALASALAKAFAPDAPLGKFLAWIGTKFLEAVIKIMNAVKSLIKWVDTFATMIAIMWEDKKLFLDPKSAWIMAESKRSQRISESGKEHLMAAKQAADNVKYMHDIGSKATNLIGKQWEKAKREYKKYGGDPRKLHRYAEMEKLYGKKEPKTPGARPSMYQDFRGSKFDITQEFAEGFDPGRIAVAFANDLAALGERRLQSGLAPTFAVR